MGEDEGKPLNLQAQGRIRPKAKENHAGMGTLEPKYPLAEIPIISDEDTSFSTGKGENFWVKKSCGILFCNSSDIVSKDCEVGSEPGISTLIKHEFHSWGGGIRFSSTAWWAYCKQALTSSTVSSGYAAKRSFRSGLFAKCATTRSTGIRVPLTTGLPTMTAGFVVIRSLYMCCFSAICPPCYENYSIFMQIDAEIVVIIRLLLIESDTTYTN